MESQKFLRRKQTGEYLLSKYGFGAERTLDKLAVTGGGPEFRKAGRFPVYMPEALDAWALSKIGGPVRSTSEARMACRDVSSHEAAAG
jgi:hypothetical protein